MNDPIFIVGNSRSGTTLVSRILKKHPKIHILNETHFMEEFKSYHVNLSSLSRDTIWKLVNQMLTIQRKDYYRKFQYQEYPEDAKRIISVFFKHHKQNFNTLNRVFFEYEATRHGKEWAGDQTPRHIFYVQKLQEMYPSAKFIQMVRNPCAVLFSQKNKWKAGLRWGVPKFEIIRTFLNYHPITTAYLWKKCIEAGWKAHQTISKGAMKIVLFENLVENPGKEIKELCDFLQIEFFPDMINVSVEMSSSISEEGYKGISKSVSQRWIGSLSETEVFIAEILTSNQLQSLGYGHTKAKPNLIKLMFYLLILPLHLSLAFTFNLGRTGNPFTLLSNIFVKK